MVSQERYVGFVNNVTDVRSEIIVFIYSIFLSLSYLSVSLSSGDPVDYGKDRLQKLSLCVLPYNVYRHQLYGLPYKSHLQAETSMLTSNCLNVLEYFLQTFIFVFLCVYCNNISIDDIVAMVYQVR